MAARISSSVILFMLLGLSLYMQAYVSAARDDSRGLRDNRREANAERADISGLRDNRREARSERAEISGLRDNRREARAEREETSRNIYGELINGPEKCPGNQLYHPKLGKCVDPCPGEQKRDEFGKCRDIYYDDK